MGFLEGRLTAGLSFNKFSTCVSQAPRLDGSREMDNGNLSSPLSQSEAVCSGTSYSY